MRQYAWIFLWLVATALPASGRAAGRIGVIAALPQELAALKGALERPREENRGADTFHIGQLGGFTVVLTLSGIGKVNAAVATQRLVSEFRIKGLIVTGVAGGISDRVSVGDVVVSQRAFQHDYGHLGEAFAVHAVGTAPEFGIGKGDEPLLITSLWPAFGGERREFLKVVQELFVAERERLTNVIVDDKEYRPMIRTGVVATGDQFVANDAKKKELAKLGADIVEMEGGAIAQVGAKNGIPVLIVRSVSDRAGEKAKVDFTKFFPTVATNNATLVRQLLTDERVGAYLRSLR